MEWKTLDARPQGWSSGSPATPYTAHSRDMQFELTGCRWLFCTLLDLSFMVAKP